MTAIFLAMLMQFNPVYADKLPDMLGNRYDIGGYQLHMYCIGEGSPTVIIDTGLGDDSSDWQSIHQQSAKVSRSCVYDRSGYGWSDVGPRPRSSRRIAYELALLLTKAEIPAPYILVGHSFGGFNVRLFAASHPDEVAGIVLVEASHEQQYDRLNINLPPPYKGRRNIFITSKLENIATDDPKGYALRDRAFRSAAYEIAALSQSSAQVARYGNIPTVPLIVISRGKAEWYGNEDAQKREQTWIDLQQDLSKLSSISQHIFANHSGHDIPKQQPQIIIDAISDVIHLARLMSSP